MDFMIYGYGSSIVLDDISSRGFNMWNTYSLHISYLHSHKNKTEVGMNTKADGWERIFIFENN